MTDYTYILTTIGPVQSAIAQARRTQDVYIGSRLLTVLIQAGLSAVWNPDAIIFPVVGTDATSVPNRIWLRCSASQAQEQLTAIETAIRNKWQDITRQTRSEFQRRTGLPIQAAQWERSLSTWLEIYSISVIESGDYVADYHMALRHVAARKLSRAFVQIEEPGHKCSLTGEQEALHDSEVVPASLDAVNNYWDTVRSKQRNLAILGKGERLGALALVKRFAHEAINDLAPNRFPSTSSIASAPFRAKVIEQWATLKDKVLTYLDGLETYLVEIKIDPENLYFWRNQRRNEEYFPYIVGLAKGISLAADENLIQRFRSIDGDFLYPESLEPEALAEFLGYTDNKSAPPEKNSLKIAHQALADLYKAAAQIKPSPFAPPTDYLAVIAMDGDRMGATLSGMNQAEHQQFSAALAAFAQTDVATIVEQASPGRLIYAGGDDLLAIVPAENALANAEAIRTAFATQFPGLHLSAGIAYVHRTYPLQGAIRVAQDALKRAKDEFYRNAIGVALLMRSGEPIHLGMRWQVENHTISDLVNRTAVAMRNSHLSRSLAHDLEEMVYALAESDPYEMRDMRAAEFRRILHRRWQAKRWMDDAKQIENPDLIAIRTAAIQFAEYGVITENVYHVEEPAPALGWHNMRLWLRLARFLAGLYKTEEN